jgi:hypothetical protein
MTLFVGEETLKRPAELKLLARLADELSNFNDG